MVNRETLADSIMAGSRIFVSISGLLNDLFSMPQEAVKLSSADSDWPFKNIAAAILNHAYRA